ncbi:uncharacterized protein BYT42DRAFT_546084 [Radiomyces spectabilis]|uniref:uncharacterized protein n=1 Tax=Radiomyces spectabilis TaxID=64574 RepID=UPI002220B0FA|nr:uncharacterized protein BYT42DRAFT_546084 [Radiomyces spectabilis]KAI8379787.1 hypothetical protein BYT42DRAFT_546084 [Radiomyces spectabilis]
MRAIPKNIRRQVDQTVEAIQSSLLQRSASELENIIGAPAATSASSSERPSSKKKQKPSVACNNFLEHDGIRPCDSELSVGTKIKRECLKKYPRYKTLDDQGKALVALGANSILDLTNPNSAHQELFSSQEWKDLSHQFRPMFENNTALLEENNSSLREIEK